MVPATPSLLLACSRLLASGWMPCTAGPVAADDRGLSCTHTVSLAVYQSPPFSTLQQHPPSLYLAHAVKSAVLVVTSALQGVPKG